MEENLINALKKVKELEDEIKDLRELITSQKENDDFLEENKIIHFGQGGSEESCCTNFDRGEHFGMGDWRNEKRQQRLKELRFKYNFQTVTINFHFLIFCNLNSSHHIIL